MIRLCAVLLLFISGSALAGAPQRVVSLNLCTDQLALAFAREGQLKGVSFNAANPAFSAQHERAQDYPLLRGEAEELLAIRPDLVLMGEGQNPALQAWLRERGIRVLALGAPDSVNEVQRQVAEMGRALGSFAPVFMSFGQGLALLAGSFQPLDARVAMVYPGGFADGSHSFMDDMITRAGGENMVQGDGARQLSLEEIVAAQPDVLAVQGSGFARQSQAEAMLEHPALRKLPSRRVVLPGAWLACPHLHMAKIAQALRESRP